MTLLKRKDRLPVAAGARFEKVGLWGAVWTVEEVFHPQGLPAHVRLSETINGRLMTVAESVLHDPDVFRAAPANQHLPDSQ